MQRSLPIPSASRASPRNRRHYPPQLGSTHRKRSQHRPQSNHSLANLMTPGVSKSLTRSAAIARINNKDNQRHGIILSAGAHYKAKFHVGFPAIMLWEVLNIAKVIGFFTKQLIETLH